MFNTYGIRSITTDTFNMRLSSPMSYPRTYRNIVVTALRLNNLVFNVLGYIPGVSFFSGCGRILVGLSICILTLTVGERNAKSGYIIGRWYDEALVTGVAQIARGLSEAFMTYGRLVNLSLDVIGTVVNVGSELKYLSCAYCAGMGRDGGPHEDPLYPIPFLPLYLA